MSTNVQNITHKAPHTLHIEKCSCVHYNADTFDYIYTLLFSPIIISVYVSVSCLCQCFIAL